MIGGETKAMRLELDDYRDSATKGTVDFLYRLSDLVKAGDISANAEMKPGDILLIPQSWF